jgi:hypothetical protein
MKEQAWGTMSLLSEYCFGNVKLFEDFYFWDITPYCLLHADFLLGLFFDHEGEDNIFFQNVGRISPNYTALDHVDKILRGHRCEIIKSNVKSLFILQF